jgi:hypothetical protein
MIESQVVSLTAALRNNEIEYRVYLAAPGDFRVQASSSTAYTTAQLQALEAAHGVSARTNRAEFR